MKKKNETNILVVDDKPANIFALESLLSDGERNILHASNGKDALKIALNENIDLIILDVQMPEMDGFEVASILKSSSRTKDIPIIFASAEKKELDSIIKGYEEGAFDYLFKPLDPGIAKAKVSVLLKLQKQKKELQEKNDSLQRSALLINNSADIIGVIDPVSFIMEEMNQAFAVILGYSPEETKNTPLTFFLTKQDRDEIIRLSKSSETLLSFETQLCCKDNSMKWLQWKVVVNGGKWYVNARDITELKNANDEIHKLNKELRENNLQLQATNRELESFSYSVSHDLRAPLRAMNGFSSILREDYDEVLDNEGKRLLRSIEANARKMGALIDDLLAFSRLGKKEMERSLIDMTRLVRDVVGEAARTSQSAEIKIHPLPETYGDAKLLTQVWVNLVSNAIKYSSRKEFPVIEIGAEKNGDYITYYIKDNGAGFSMEYIHKIFGVFQRLHGQEEFEGTGIGLAIVQRIISRHGGRVWAEGAVEQGATFYFTLPVPAKK